MSDLMKYYDLSPVGSGALDQNQWTLQTPGVALAFRQNALYTPLIDWDGSPSATGAITTRQTELLEGDVDSNPIPLTANFVEAQGIDSRYQEFTVERHGKLCCRLLH